MKNNPIIRDLLKLAMWGLLASLFYGFAINYNISSQQLYVVGITMGVLMCFILDALSSLVMNMSIIIKLTMTSPEDFGKFLKGLGCDVNIVSSEEENNNE